MKRSFEELIGNLHVCPLRLVVLLEAMFASPITGTSINPARSIAPNFVSGHLEHHWINISTPIVGCFLAVVSSKLVKEDDCCENKC